MKRTIFRVPLFFLLFAALFVGSAKAQNYDQAIGLRGGVGASITYKKFFSEQVAMELLGGRYDFDYWGVSGMVLFHNELSNNGRLLWYWGGGPYWLPRDGTNAFGLAGAIGLDFSLESVPLNFTLDFLPQLQFKGGGFIFSGGGLGIRYILQY